MSSKLQEKQQQQDSKRHVDADSLLNKHIFNTLAYTFGGYAAGMATSLLFKRKAGIPLLMAGAGAGYGLSNLYGDMERLKKFQGQDSGSSHTLKRNDVMGKDWEKYQTKEEGQYNAKPRYGGSDDSDDKSSKTENKSSQKKDEGKGGEKSQKGVDSHKDQKQLTHLEGKVYDKSGDNKGSSINSGTGSSKNKENDSKSKEHDSKSKEHDSKSKESSSKGKDSDSDKDHKDNKDMPKATETRGAKQRGLNPKDIGPDTKTESVTSGKTGGGIGHSFDDSPAQLGATRSYGEPEVGTSIDNRRGGQNTEKVQEALNNQRASEQDRIGKSISRSSGPKLKHLQHDENVAGGEFRGKSHAGSQVNAVIE